MPQLRRQHADQAHFDRAADCAAAACVKALPPVRHRLRHRSSRSSAAIPGSAADRRTAAPVPDGSCRTAPGTSPCARQAIDRGSQRSATCRSKCLSRRAAQLQVRGHAARKRTPPRRGTDSASPPRVHRHAVALGVEQQTRPDDRAMPKCSSRLSGCQRRHALAVQRHVFVGAMVAQFLSIGRG